VSSRAAGTFAGKQAIVTGGGSGIGAALCRALVAAGADVVCTDVDGAAAARTVESLGGPGSATSVILDVTDPAAVKAAVDAVVARAGRLDLMFNNAGIAWGGDTELLTLEQWNAIIDVNIRGVVHGVTGAVETPILDKGAIGGFVGRDYYLRGQGMKDAYSADRLARDTLQAIDRNKGLLVKPKQAYASWVFARLAPGLLQRMSIRFIADQRKRQHAKSGASEG
jgi:NAD(P)-dependent dehydrogenase (short-subunit alcohol dehydrogenase family)